MANTATVVVATRKVTQIAAINVNIIMDVVTNRIAVITIQIAAITIQIAAITTQIAVITGDQDSSHCSAAVAADTGNSWAAALH